MKGSMRTLIESFDAELPLARARTIPNVWYSDPQMFQLEREAVFAATWQVVGRSDQVSDPGTYVTAEIAGEPVLVVRGDDGVLRGFFNVCRHRAAPIVTDHQGTVNKLRCRYHGWTYDLAGCLRGTPEFHDVEEFCKEENGLVPLGGVAEWGSFVWVHLTVPREPVETFLDPLPVWCETSNAMTKLQFAERKSYTLACNWKVYVDNYLDGGYHVNTVHPGLAGVLDYSEYTTTCYSRTSLQSSPLKSAPGVEGKTRTGNLAAYWWVYPNFMVNLYSGVMDTNRVLPLGTERCQVIFDFYFARGTDPAFIRDSIAVADQVQMEDLTICEEVQRGLSSRSFSTGRFSVQREASGYHFHQLLSRQLREKLDPMQG